MDLKSYIREVPDFPKKGISYKDIQPLLEDDQAFFDALYEMGELVDLSNVDYFVGIESRGFIFASALAAMNMKGFKMIRKKGKLPPGDLITLEVFPVVEFVVFMIPCMAHDRTNSAC